MNKYTGLTGFIVLAFLFASSFLFQQQSSLITKDSNYLQKAFEQWIAQNGKIYKMQEQKDYRFLKFKYNYNFVKQHNAKYQAGKQTFSLGLNQFADMDNIQFAAIYNRKKSSESSITKTCKTKLDIKTDLPETVDWADKAVGMVRNQGQCGSCWAFSACASLEGLDALKNGKVRMFSPQQLVDCSKSYSNVGCTDGQVDQAFWYVIDNGIALESSYSYQGSQQKCKYTSSMKAFSINDCAQIKVNSSLALKSAVYTQPVSISVQADTTEFQLYRSGVFNGKCGTTVDHSILLTGYGTVDGKDYWKCKNSWGPTWGQGGYILIARNDSLGGPGQCGILIRNNVPLLL